MRRWTARQWGVAAGSAVLIALMMGFATAIIDNPIFVRMIPTPWWAYLAWISSAVLLGLLIATYVTPRGKEAAAGQQHQRRGLVAGVLAWFAVACPTCNVLVVTALGVNGAVAWFQPLQPVLAVISLALLVLALRSRLRNVENCPVPGTSLRARLGFPPRAGVGQEVQEPARRSSTTTSSAGRG